MTAKVLRGAAENRHACAVMERPWERTSLQLDANFLFKCHKIRHMLIVCGVILRLIANKVIEAPELQHLLSLIKLNRISRSSLFGN